MNISQSLNTDKYKDSQYKINYTIANTNTNNYQMNNKIKQKQKLTKYPTHMYNNHSNSNILENYGINTNKKTNLLNNNCDSSILKNLKKISLFTNITNSRSCYKLYNPKKSNINSNINNISCNKKKYLNINNNESYNDNINNNISYNLRNKGMSRNYSNFGKK